MPLHHRTVKWAEIDFRELVYLMNGPYTSEGGYSINLISCCQCTAEKTFWLEAIRSTFFLAVQKNSVSYIVDEVHAFILDMHMHSL